MPEVLVREQAVAETKWFGYRFMSPLAATMLFAELYREILKRHVRAQQDVERAQQVRGLAFDLFDAPSRVLTEVWNARLRADEMGIPYQLLIEFGLDFASRRKWQNPPRPGQVFGTENSRWAWFVKLEQFLDGRFEACIRELSDLPQYRAESYRGLQSQMDLRDYLFEELRSTTQPWAMMLQSYCLVHRYLPVSVAIGAVPKQMRRNVISSIRSDVAQGHLVVAPVERLPLVSFVPACFGLPVPRSSGCNGCPFAVQCEKSSGIVGETMNLRHGTLSPLQDQRDQTRKEGQRRRTSRHRARKGGCMPYSSPSI
ncbi:hypothetical protein F4695_003809 [Rhizobium soli]|uniref:Uncharacterized protein n=1 Tax=Rhizobium soli TaxID=424798 RepID=A0A7X0JNJ4_9HYPH|nr:hypothetical protein [Rhizobium soli]MBB6510420.1 hypothetical protein [Rhizobium soli]